MDHDFVYRSDKSGIADYDSCFLRYDNSLDEFILLTQMLDFQDLYDILYSNRCVLNMPLSLFKFVILR